jgi:hypothetical protein
MITLKINGKMKPVDKCTKHEIVVANNTYESIKHLSKEERDKFEKEHYFPALRSRKPVRVGISSKAFKKKTKPSKRVKK